METAFPDKALILFSGGQDSAVCLAWALANFSAVETIGFNYGQRHRIELETRESFLHALRADFPEWGERLGVDRVIDLSVLGEVSDTALTREVEIAMADDGLPNTFVPGRNLVFFTLAGAVAYRRGLKHLVGGMCETDYSGYPDCRDTTIKSLQATMNLGMAANLVLHTPLMWLDKAQTWQLADTLGGPALVEAVVERTHTCYLGERGARHAWGYGCGACPACKLRAAGFAAYRKGRANDG